MGYSSWGCKELDTTEQLAILLFSEHSRHTVSSLCAWVFSTRSELLECGLPLAHMLGHPSQC